MPVSRLRVLLLAAFALAITATPARACGLPPRSAASRALSS